MAVTVFISSKSGDYGPARRVYEYLMAQGIGCFFSEETLSQLGEAEYKKAIEESLDAASYLVLVTSSRENAESRWVRHEWNSFDNEILAGRKSGNIITVLCGGMAESDLPYALRSRQALKLESQLDRLPSYVGRKKDAPVVTPPAPAASSPPVSTRAEAPHFPAAMPPIGPDGNDAGPAAYRSSFTTTPLPVDPDVQPPFQMPDLQWFGLWVGSSLAVTTMGWILISSRSTGSAPAGFMLWALFTSLAVSGTQIVRSWWVLSRCWVVSRWWLAIIGIVFATDVLIYGSDVWGRILHSMRGNYGLTQLTAVAIANLVSSMVRCLTVQLPQSLLLRRQLGGAWWWFGTALGARLLWGSLPFWISSEWSSDSKVVAYLAYCIPSLFFDVALGLLAWWRAQVVSGKRRSV